MPMVTTDVARPGAIGVAGFWLASLSYSSSPLSSVPACKLTHYSLLFTQPLTRLYRTSRRRRAKGGTPIYGTGWMPGVGGQQANNNNYQPPPPQYGQQQNYNAGPGQESGYAPPPPTAPKPAYNGGQQGNYDMPQYNNGNAGANSSYYNPPAGPPPGQYK